MPFESLEDFATLVRNAPQPDAEARQAAIARNAVLTKPPGALGRLEDLAIWYASWRANPRPSIDAPQVIIFAGNHGVTAQGVSAFPAEVTAQMVANFQAGGAAINQLSRLIGAKLDVVALDLDTPTADFTQGPAMSEAECVAALRAGWEAVSAETDLLVVGEMGIGNTTAAATIAAALLGGAPRDWVGRGTGVDDAGLERKSAAVAAGLAANPSRAPLSVLTALGGREIAAMVGAMAAARVARVPMVLDGFIASAAALVLHALSTSAIDHMVAGHLSAEGAHGRILEAMNKPPLVSLGLRLGEGSGAALAVSVLQGALACHSDMASFEEAGVADS